MLDETKKRIYDVLLLFTTLIDKLSWMEFGRTCGKNIEWGLHHAWAIQ